MELQLQEKKKIKTPVIVEQEESRETIEISDIKFSETLEKNSDINVPKELSDTTIVTSALKSFLSEDFKTLSNLFYVLLPKYLNFYFQIKYNTSSDSKFYKTIVLKKRMLDVLTYLEKLKIKQGKVKTILKDLSKFPVEPENLDNLHDFCIFLKRINFQKKLSGNDLKVFRWFYKVFTSEDINEKALKKILVTVNYITDPSLKKLLRSINIEGADPIKKLTETQNQVKKVTKKYFKTDNPSVKEIEKLRNKDYDAYKNWRKALVNVKRAGKELLQSAWADKKIDKVEVSKARAILKELNLQDPIDKGFVGMVGLAPTASMFFTYYTSKGKQLVNTPGTSIKMNKLYDSAKDNTYYCSSIPAGSTTNKPYRHYTIDFTRQSSGKLYSSSKQMVEKIDDIRQKVTKDMVSAKGATRFAAIIVKLADLTCARIGNEKSEKVRERFGLHNLKVGHLTIKSGKCTIKYTGKTGKGQKHVVTDQKTVKVLADLIADRKKNEYLFTKNGKKPITPNTVNNYLKAIGFPGTHHTFRKYHASRMFSEFLDQVKIKKGDKKKTISDYKKALEKIADLLGNTIGVAASSYVDPVLQIKYFKEANVEPPNTLKKAIKKSYAADPDTEED